jgi:hypothetical protein
LKSEYLLETITGLANDNKTGANGKPAFLQLVLTANKFSDEFRQSKPAFFLQKNCLYTTHSYWHTWQDTGRFIKSIWIDTARSLSEKKRYFILLQQRLM